MNDIVPREYNVELTTQEGINWLRTIREDVKSDHLTIEDRVKMLAATNVADTAAKQTRLDNFIREAAYTVLETQRAIGRDLLLMDKNPGGGDRKSEVYKNHPSSTPRGDLPTLKELNISYDNSSQYQTMAKLPNYAFEYALKAQNIPTMAGVLREYKRYDSLKTVINENVDEDEREEKLRNFVMNGYSLAQALSAVMPLVARLRSSVLAIGILKQNIATCI